MIYDYGHAKENKENFEKLAFTNRETEVVKRLSEGATVGEIAIKLRLSNKTVEYHSAKARRKIGSPSIAVLTRFAIINGLTKLEMQTEVDYVSNEILDTKTNNQSLPHLDSAGERNQRKRMSKILIFLTSLLLPAVCFSQFIGNTNNGTSYDGMGADQISVTRFLCSANMTITNILAKIATSSGSGVYKCAIYSENSSLPGQFLIGTSETTVSGTTAELYNFNLTSSFSLTNNQYYWLTIWSSDGGSRVYYTSPGTFRWGNNYTYGGDWPATVSLPNSSTTYNYCIYATNTLVSPPVITYPATNLVTLAWDASPDSVVGYNIYYGVASASYTNSVIFGDVLTATVSNLVGGVTYYFAATARDSSGLESDFSNEINYLVSTNSISTNIPPMINLRVIQN